MSDAAVPRVEALLEHARWARSLARELVGGDLHQAEDLAQEALAAALARPPEDEQRAQGWLGKVLRNRRVSNLRREDARSRAEPRAARAEAQPSTLELVEQAETQRRLVACVLSLEEPYRRVVLLRWFGDLPPREIARVENLPLATVTSRLTRAHAKLREKLERDYRGEGRNWAQALAPLALADLRSSLAGGAASGAASSAQPFAGWTALIAAALSAGIAWLGWAVWSASEHGPSALEAPGSLEARSEAESSQQPARESTPTDSERNALASADAVTSSPLAAERVLRGRVVLPDGSPAAGARVGTGDPQWLGRSDAPASFAAVTTDESGRFSFDEAAAQRFAPTIELVATHSAAAPSAPLRIDRRTLASTSPPTSAGTAAELLLELRRGARVEGLVFGPDGKPAPARAVRLISDFGAPPREASSDQGGAFAFDTLAPGRWTILSFPSDSELAEHRLGAPGSVAAFEHLAQRTLELADGAREFVELGRAPDQPVVVTGRVTARGVAQSALLQFVGPGARALELQRIARCDEQGRYRVALAEPGPYLVKLTVFGEAGTHFVERVLEVPAQAQLARDFELPTGALRGRVVDADGQPVSGASVRLRRERGGARSLLSSFSDAKPSGPDGGFAFEFLDDGAWSLSVHREAPKSAAGAQAQLESNTAEQDAIAKTAASVSAVLDVRDGRSVDDVVIRIASGVLLRGFLHDAQGAPLAFASLFVHGADGRPLTPFAWSASDAEGGLRGPALAPGEWWIHARNATLCSTPQRVTVTRDSPPVLDLELTAGGFVDVRFPDAQSAARATLSLRDQAGREFAGLVERAHKSLDVLSSFEPGLARLGPLPPGLYRLEVYDLERSPQRFDAPVAAGERTAIVVR